MQTRLKSFFFFFGTYRRLFLFLSHMLRWLCTLLFTIEVIKKVRLIFKKKWEKEFNAIAYLSFTVFVAPHIFLEPASNLKLHSIWITFYLTEFHFKCFFFRNLKLHTISVDFHDVQPLFSLSPTTSSIQRIPFRRP